MSDKPLTAKQEIKRRDKLRKLQDKILAHPASQKFAQDHGEHHPIFEGGPSTAAMRAYVHPAHQTQLERLHHDLYSSQHTEEEPIEETEEQYAEGAPNPIRNKPIKKRTYLEQLKAGGKPPYGHAFGK